MKRKLCAKINSSSLLQTRLNICKASRCRLRSSDVCIIKASYDSSRHKGYLMIRSLFSRTDSFIMLLSVLLLVIISHTEAGYYGTVLSYTTKDVQGDRFTVVRRYKIGYSSCEETQSWLCPCCPTIDESRGEWCLRDYTWKWTDPIFIYHYNSWDTGTWINNRNRVLTGRFEIQYDLRKRSDINRPNSSPQTGIIPVVRVPSNCQRNINLLTFDPDGDNVRCRYATSSSECYTCTPPSVLSLSSSCSLSFSPTSSNVEGLYAVQLVMQDFPRRTVTLTYYDGSTYSLSSISYHFSEIPVQFAFKVDPAAPSCTAGEYLPRFLPPTPEHGAQFFINVNETIEINITAEATQSVITELLFSGPINMVKNSSGSGNFTLTWTPSAIDDKESHPICFVVQASASSSIYQSELGCVIVTVGNDVTSTPVAATTVPLTTTSPVNTSTALNATTVPLTTTSPVNTSTTLNLTTVVATTVLRTSTSPPPKTSRLTVLKLKILTTLSLKDNKDEIEKAIKDELIRRGLHPDIKVRLLSHGSVKVNN
ncbi:uncharacterized threonine-rich GPI-anchored glycoprotein PJ4664.02-like isoform X2 [Xiphophorus couchianus]|uniref:uncharacterized threonine-rich GPI-anchored glycoprotein PJ4664.02-like isoform X2 n=1 Tax=Xiphophorus couchianus TaxID=32473 RepID=UPI001016941C|nr:uncharacterized threonine-rich GPI-anchored glycoprotein PJ4664.02-like isoform X2 [Xiphophorus couchianus]